MPLPISPRSLLRPFYLVLVDVYGTPTPGVSNPETLFLVYPTGVPLETPRKNPENHRRYEERLVLRDVSNPGLRTAQSSVDVLRTTELEPP